MPSRETLFQVPVHQEGRGGAGNALRRPLKERTGLLWNGVVKLLENSLIPAVKKLPADLISEYVIGQNLTMLKQQ